MVRELNLEFDIRPVPKGRPRFARGRVFTPASTTNFEKFIATKTQVDMAVKKFSRFEGPIEVAIMFQYKRPKKTAMEFPRADLDNLCKGVCDGLNEIAFVDDRQIVILAAAKEWGDKDSILVTIREHGPR